MPSMPDNKDPKEFSRQLETAQTGGGSAWMDAEEGFAFAEYALSMGFGVSIMEVHGVGESRGKYTLDHLIIGVDELGNNWVDHRNSARALEIVRRKMLDASKDGLDLKYKFWLEVPI